MPASTPAPRGAAGHLVAVLDIQPIGALSPALARMATTFIIDAADGVDGIETITNADIETMLSAEAQRDLLGCTEVSCYSNFGGSLGAAWVLYGSFGGFGEEALLTVSLIDVNEVKVRGRFSESFVSTAHMKQRLPVLVRDMLAKARSN